MEAHAGHNNKHNGEWAFELADKQREIGMEILKSAFVLEFKSNQDFHGLQKKLFFAKIF